MARHYHSSAYQVTSSKRADVFDRVCGGRPAFLVSTLLVVSILPFVYFFSGPPIDPQHISAIPAAAPTVRRRFPFSFSSPFARSPDTAPLKFVTLAFNFSVEHQLIDHNCALLSRTPHAYEIHTDDLTQPYCSVCTCVRFTPVNCTCALPGQSNCGLCEKLHFLVRVVTANAELVFLDSDLFIVRPDFPALLRRRTADFDFLAMYDDWGGPCKARYSSSFNTGLMYMRRLPGLDYAAMPALMQRLRTNDDQATISQFVFDHYARWDSLSLRWHCRFIWKTEKNIPPRDCITFHDRASDGMRALNRFLNVTQRTLLTTGPVSDEHLRQWYRPQHADGVLVAAPGSKPLSSGTTVVARDG